MKITAHRWVDFQNYVSAVNHAVHQNKFCGDTYTGSLAARTQRTKQAGLG